MSGGNLSGLSCGSALSRFIYSKGQVILIRNSETGYGYVNLNLGGKLFHSHGHLFEIKGIYMNNNVNNNNM